MYTLPDAPWIAEAMRWGKPEPAEEYEPEIDEHDLMADYRMEEAYI